MTSCVVCTTRTHTALISKIKGETGGRVNVTRPLTHPLDYSEEGLAVNATHACSTEGCDQPIRARGLCLKCYDRAKNAGTLARHDLRRTRITTCTLDDCNKPSNGRFCATHASRLKRTGTTEPRKGATAEQDIARFWSKVSRGADNECWPWRGVILSTGYGQFRAQGRRHMAHRYAYAMVIGPIPDGLHLDHVWARGCHRTDCVNPSHLEPVTPRENTLRSNSASALNARKNECRQGHPYRTAPDGRRYCPSCKAEWERHRTRRTP